MFDGIDPLLTNDDLIRHLQAVQSNLTEGGLYVVDLTHPRDCSPWDYGRFIFQGERDVVEVKITWATNGPQFDWQTAVAEVEVRMQVRHNGQETTIMDRAMEHFLDPQAILQLAHVACPLEVVGWYGASRLDQPFDGTERSNRMIAVLQNQD